MRRVTILLVLTAALFALAAPAYAADKDCPDFASHDEAQAYFKANGGSPANNVDRLDRDRDGVACEDLPSRSSGGLRGRTPADRGERLADTGPGDIAAPAAVGLLAAGLLLVATTRYRGRHAR